MAFHAKNGWFFERESDGSVTIRKSLNDAADAMLVRAATVTLEPDAWASVMASVCGISETGETFRAAQEFHKAGSVTDVTLARHHTECEHVGNRLESEIRNLLVLMRNPNTPADWSVAIETAQAAADEWNGHQWPDLGQKGGDDVGAS